MRREIELDARTVGIEEEYLPRAGTDLLPACSRSFAMIRVSGEQARGAVDLLSQQHADEAVRQRHRGQLHARCRACLELGIEAVRAADDERDGGAVVAP